MGAGWKGIMEEYRPLLPIGRDTPVVTLLEGGTPLVPAPRLSERVGANVWLKVEGANPTGSFKDRGMTMAISMAVEEGAKAVVCASTGNTSASAAAYAARAGLTCVVLIPGDHIALGKLAQALVHGARVLQVRGNFDQLLSIVRDLPNHAPITVVNSVNPHRIEGQKTGAFEIVDVLARLPAVQRDWPLDEVAAHARLPGRGRGADRARSPSGESGHDRHCDTDRQPGQLVFGHGGGQ
jgi:threonine synthase